MTREQLHEKIGIAIGSASMCWIPIPSGIFDSDRAGKICLNLTDEIAAKLEIYENALKEYANGTAIRVKPEKAHLYVEDFKHGSPEWLQRSMSDYDDTLLAKQALSLHSQSKDKP
jgi:hypothetical protein